MLGRALKMAFWVTYDHLGKLLLANLFCALILLVPGYVAYAAALRGDPAAALLAGVGVAVLTLGVLLPVMAAGLAHLAKELIDTRDGSLRTFFTGMRRYAGRAAGLGLVYVLAAGCLVTSVWFYASRLGARIPWLGYALSALALWGLVFAGLTALLCIPALVQKGGGVWSTVKLSGLLVLDNPLFCVGLAIHVAILGVFCLLPPVFLLLSMAPVMVLLSSGYEMLARKYAALEARGGAGTEPAFDEDTDDYLNRGFRDFLFPWKG